MEPSKADWKLYIKKIPGWQEAYMEKALEMIEYLGSKDKSWKVEGTYCTAASKLLGEGGEG